MVRSWLPHMALSLWAVMCLNILSIPLTYLDFQLRQDYYAKVLCVNQDQPIAVCGGRCFVDRQIARMQPDKQHSRDAHPKAPVLTLDRELYLAASRLELALIKQEVLQPACPFWRPLVLTDYVATIFHPPRA